VEAGVFALYQNEPNPFDRETVIRYTLPKDSEVKLTVYDVAGKVLRVVNQEGRKGLNQIVLHKSELGRTGVMYYQLDAADHTSTRRMVVIE
jgi:hypothetical protein